MNIEEFENNTQEAIDKIEITTDYIPYIEKKSHCKGIADVTSHKRIADKSIFVVDSPTRHLFYIMKLVSLYTNVEFDEMSISSAYDALNKTGALDYIFENIIPETEQQEWKSIMDMVMDDMYENEKSVSTILGSMKDSIGLVIGSMISAMEEAAEENGEIENTQI